MTNNTFVGVDGEGITRNTRHIYTLLGASTGAYIENYKQGLNLPECLDFLLSLRGNGILCGFSFDYDINMIVKNQLNESAFASLKKNHCCHIKRPDGFSYRIEHASRKFTRIYFGVESQKEGKNRWITREDIHGKKKMVTIWDVWGFFQSSFVSALITWNILTKAEVQAIEDMKAQRDKFKASERHKIRAYNLEECVRLAELMDKVREKLRGLDLELTRWHGAGAVASALYEKFKCKPYFPKSEAECLLGSYFGGRIQAVQLGHFDEGMFSYDIRSAYPYAQSQLPLFHNAEPEPVKDIGPYDVCDVEWKLPDTTVITPFPYRLPDDSIQFYTSGRGYYHSAEVLEALKHFRPYMKIHQTWRVPQDDTVRPFAFIHELYQYRAMLRELGDEAHIAIKLGLNSLYGKCAQKKSYRGRPPSWRSYMIAGAITSTCRTMLLRAALSSPETVVMFATDGIASTKPLDLPLGEQLGLWEESHYDEFRLYQAGMYWHRKGEKVKAKTRSISPRAVDWEYCAKEWLLHGPTATFDFNSDAVHPKYRIADFVTYGIASKNLPHAEWIVREKVVSLRPNKGVCVFEEGSPIVRLAPVFCPSPDRSALGSWFSEDL